MLLHRIIPEIKKRRPDKRKTYLARKAPRKLNPLRVAYTKYSSGAATELSVADRKADLPTRYFWYRCVSTTPEIDGRCSSVSGATTAD